MPKPLSLAAIKRDLWLYRPFGLGLQFHIDHLMAEVTRLRAENRQLRAEVAKRDADA